MAYTVKLKNQSGTEVTYSAVEQVAIPLSTGNGNAYFMAKYDVSKIASSNITYEGGEASAHGVDYICRISVGSTLYKVPNNISITIGGSVATENVAYTYTRLSDSEAFVSINGSSITGDIAITAIAQAV